MGHAFYTIGHSRRSIRELAGLLGSAGASRLADVRAVPRSRANPQFDQDTLAAGLGEHGIDYAHIAALGGLRRRSPDIAPDVNDFWQNRSFHNYADYASSEAFRAGLLELLALARAAPCGIMCAEALWWRCHRRIIADHLIGRGECVFHILGPGNVQPARLTDGAVVTRDGVVYPAASE